MRKSTSFKIALFAFVSAIICIIGNGMLCLDIISYTAQGLGFVSYLFFAIWVSQLIYGRTRFGGNLICLFMSFALALYSCVMFAANPEGLLFDYYVIFFYLFSLICLVSSILLVGRIIFCSPKKQKEQHESLLIDHSTANQWKCACGCFNTGKFCSACGAPMPTEVIEVVSEE